MLHQAMGFQIKQGWQFLNYNQNAIEKKLRFHLHIRFSTCCACILTTHIVKCFPRNFLAHPLNKLQFYKNSSFSKFLTENIRQKIIFQVGALTMDLDLGIISESEKRLKKKLILDYIYANLKHHNFWAYRYFFCEFLALINVVGK